MYLRACELFVPTRSSGPLYVATHWPAGGRARTRVVFCPPVGDEHRNARTVLLRLAEQLASAGHGVAVYDPFGHGDSAGEIDQASPQRLIEDLAAVAAHPSLGAGAEVVVGFRAGAAIAVEALARGMISSARRLVLVAPALRLGPVDARLALAERGAGCAPHVVMIRAMGSGEEQRDALCAARSSPGATLCTVDEARFWIDSPDYIASDAPRLLATLLDVVASPRAATTWEAA